jgi:MFS family permease
MNIMSVTVTTVTPLMVVSLFGTNMKTLGLIEGIVTASAFVSKIFSGVISDFFRRRKFFILMGYGVSALTMPIFALAPTVGWVFFARFIDRLSNGFRDAPRDALISDITPKQFIGLCYGFRQSLGILGSVLGPLIIILFLHLTNNNYQKVFWFATIPALIALLIGIVGVHDPAHFKNNTAKRRPLKLADIKYFKSDYWRLVSVSTIFMAGQYSDAFLILRAEKSGIPLLLIPLVLVLMNIAYSGASIPVGSFSDRVDRRVFLGIGFLSLIVANMMMAQCTNIWVLVVAVLIWGLHKGMTQSVFAAMVADIAPPHLRGTAFGFFHLISGFGQFVANMIIGWLWETQGMTYAFTVSSFIVIIPLVGLLFLRDPRTYIHHLGQE